MKNIAVFASGFGSNFESIVQAVNDGMLNCNCKVLVTDKANAYCVDRANNHGIEVISFNPKDYGTRQECEKMLVKKLQDRGIDLIVFAGYMRIVTSELISAYPNKIVNIHPALLPAFKGAHAIEDSFNYGVKVFGVTIHFVNEETDGGKIISQRSFDYVEGETIEQVEEKIHKIEHVLYVETLKKLLEE